MSLVTVQERGQVTLPGEICQALALEPGVILEAYAENGRIILETKGTVNRDEISLDEMLADSLEQVDRGEVVGPFESIDEWCRYVDSIENR